MIPTMFNAAMTVALAEAKKTQTRRLPWTLQRHSYPDRAELKAEFDEKGWRYIVDQHGRLKVWRPNHWQKAKVGDLIYVREALRWEDGELRYDADGALIHKSRWPEGFTPTQPFIRGMFMKTEFSRFTLPITALRTERLHDITDADAILEGVMEWVEREEAPDPIYAAEPRAAYRGLWDQLHAKEQWKDNPEVLVVDFGIIFANVREVAETWPECHEA